MCCRRTLERITITDYSTPWCDMCEYPTEPLHVLDEDEHTSVPLTNAGFCISCDTLIVRGDGAVCHVAVEVASGRMS